MLPIGKFKYIEIGEKTCVEFTCGPYFIYVFLTVSISLKFDSISLLLCGLFSREGKSYARTVIFYMLATIMCSKSIVHQEQEVLKKLYSSTLMFLERGDFFKKPLETFFKVLKYNLR